VFEHYRTYLHPDANNGRGFVVDWAMFDTARRRDGALMIGTPEQLTEKILDAQAELGITRFIDQFDWDGLPGRARARVDRAPGDRDRARRARRRARDPGLNHEGASGQTACASNEWRPLWAALLAAAFRVCGGGPDASSS